MAHITEEAFRAMEARAEAAEDKAREASKKFKELEAAHDKVLQDRHSLKSNVEQTMAMQAALEDELEAEKRLSENLLKTVDEFKSVEKAWRVKEAKLESEVQQLGAELTSVQDRFSNFQEAAVKVLKSPNKSASLDDSSADLINSLQEDLDAAKKEAIEFKAKFAAVEQENEQLRHQVDGLRQDVSSLREVVEEKDAELAEVMSMVAPAAAAPIANELQDLDVDEVATAKGNSLFSEVEDRRVQVEKKLKKYEAKFDELKRMLDFKTQQISKLRAQSIRLANMASCGTESSATIRRLEDLLNSEKDKSTQLQKRVAELEMATADKPVLGAPLPRRETTFNRRQTVFPQASAFAAQAHGEAEEELKKRLQAQIREKLLADEKISELAKDLRVAETQLNKFKAENYTLRVNLQRFKERTFSAVDEQNAFKPYSDPAPTVQSRTEVLVFSPEPTKETKASALRLNEVKVSTSDFALDASSASVGIDGTNASHLGDVFEDTTSGNAVSAVPKIVVENCDAKPKRKAVTFREDSHTPEKSPKRAAAPGDQENVAPGSDDVEKKEPVKKVKKSTVIDAGVEAKKIEEQCKQQ